MSAEEVDALALRRVLKVLVRHALDDPSRPHLNCINISGTEWAASNSWDLVLVETLHAFPPAQIPLDSVRQILGMLKHAKVGEVCVIDFEAHSAKLPESRAGVRWKPSTEAFINYRNIIPKAARVPGNVVVDPARFRHALETATMLSSGAFKTGVKVDTGADILDVVVVTAADCERAPFVKSLRVLFMQVMQ